MPAILREAVPATTQNVQVEIQNTTKLAFTYTGEIYDFCSSMNNEQLSGVFINFFLWSTAITEETVTNQKPLEGLSLNLLKEALINTRQHEAFLSILLVNSNFHFTPKWINLPA